MQLQICMGSLIQQKKNALIFDDPKSNQLTETIIETMLFNIPSISAASPSLKQTSQTPMILCKSSSMPLLDFSSEISAP